MSGGIVDADVGDAPAGEEALELGGQLGRADDR
jgi:hypothetical protein